MKIKSSLALLVIFQGKIYTFDIIYQLKSNKKC